MGELKAIWDGLDWSVLTGMLFSIIPALLCIVIHEMSHGFAAYLLGDATAKSQGRLSFNPLRHIDPFGLLMLVVFRFGWAKPVSVDMRNFKNPKRGMAFTALTGPLSNLLLAVFLMAVYGFFWKPLINAGETGAEIISLLVTTTYLSLGLGVFNMLPAPPLDGSKVLFAILPNELYYKLMRYERYGMIVLFVLMASGFLSRPLGIASEFAFEFIFNYIAVPMSDLAGHFF